MKKSLVVGALVLTLGVGSLAAYADTVKTPSVIPSNRNANMTIEDREAWFKERSEFQKEQIKNALESGRISEEEAKEWEDHFTYMEKFHNENGFMAGGCGGRGFGKGRGMGMMRGNGWKK